jgi:hypothetical protein
MEEVTDQIDRLNEALQQVMEGIANTSIERSHKLSIVDSNYLDAFSEGSSLEIPDDFESKLERLLLDLDRYKMILEDISSEKLRNSIKLSFTKTELKELIESLKNLYSGGHCMINLGKDVFYLTLNTNDSTNDLRDVTIIENSILDCGHDITKIRKEIALDIERSMQQKKKQYMEKATAHFEAQLEELDKLKKAYNDKLEDLVLFSTQLGKKEKILEIRELKLEKVNSDPKTAQELEEKLKDLESNCSLHMNEDQSKIELKIEQMKNKIANLRVEKVISESRHTTSVLSRVVKAMEREVSFDEKQRKKLFDKYSESHASNFDNTKSGMLGIRKQEEAFRIYTEKAKNRLKKKELELSEKEKLLEEQWKKISESKDLIELMKISIDKLNMPKE